MRHLRLLLLLSLCGILLAAPAAAQDDAALLRALADEEEERYDDALAAWEALDEARQIAVLRSALHGEDEALAVVAAWGLGPEQLSWSEIRRQMDLLARDPARLLTFRRPEWAPGDGFGLGGPDLVPLFQHAVDDTGFVCDPEAWQHVHRVASPAHVPALVALLDRAHGGIYDELVGLLGLLASYDGGDRQRALLARAFLHAVARGHAEAEDTRSPLLADVEVALGSDDGGLPPSFVTLVEAQGVASIHWLRRWAGELQPGPSDVPLLMRLADGEDAYFPFWALRHLARIGTPEARAFLDEIVEGGRGTGVLAAAALHEAGDSRHWRALQADEGRRGAALRVAWCVDPKWALEAWLAEPSELLEPSSRYALSQYEGIDVRRADLHWIAERMLREDASVLARVRFFTEIDSWGLTADLAQQMAVGLCEVSDEDLQMLDLERVRGLLEVSAPAEQRALFEARIAQLDWIDQRSTRRPGPDDDLEALRARVASDDLVVAGEAMRLLALHQGLPDRLARRMFDVDLMSELDEEPVLTARKLLLAGDAVGAVLHAYEHSGAGAVATHELGLLDDERARAVLRRLRTERHHGLYWQATAGLAIAGDEDARTEFLALLEDDRTWMFDNLPDRSLSLEGDPSLAPFWLSRLDTNCCLQFHAAVALETTFPTFPYEQMFGLPLFRPAVEWYQAALRHGLARSHVLDGWVPRAR